MSKEAMKLALEALEEIADEVFSAYDNKLGAAILALREALAERCVCGEPDTPGTHRTDGPCLAEQPAQQEPFGYFRYDLRLDAWVQNREGKPGTAFYTSPPAQRKPLTDEEIYDMYNEPRSDAEMLEFARAIEAAHGIKGDA